jgi:epsilon-lactone hydrolase
MASLRAGLLRSILCLFGVWRGFSGGQAFRQTVAKSNAKPRAQPTASMRHKLTIEGRMMDDREVVWVMPKIVKAGRVLFVHGKSYVQAPVGPHWRYIAKMAQSLGIAVAVPRYPLAPQHDVTEVMAFMLALYRALTQDVQHSPLIVMRDSVSGSVALALFQEARRLGLPMPAGLALISPWLDAAMSGPDQAQIEPRDPILRRAGLLTAGLWHAGSLPLDHPRVSPLNGPLDGMPPILMFSGDHDIRVTDACRLANRARSESHPLAYYEAPRLFHDYPLLPLPESTSARACIAAFVAKRLAQAETSGDEAASAGELQACAVGSNAPTLKSDLELSVSV